MFSGASTVDSYASGKEIVNIKLPSVSSAKVSQAEDSDKPLVNTLQSKNAPAFHGLDQQIPDLVTLSLLPRSQWQSLINLDIIKVFTELLFTHVTSDCHTFLSTNFYWCAFYWRFCLQIKIVWFLCLRLQFPGQE